MLSRFSPPIPQESWDAIYGPLVGTPENINRLHAYLAEDIPNITETTIDPYMTLVKRTGEAVVETAQDLPLSYSRSAQREMITRNTFIGMGFATAILRGMGNVYAKEAQVAQDYSSVRKDARIALLGAYSSASLDARSATNQLLHIVHGKDKVGIIKKAVTMIRLEKAAKRDQMSDIRPRAYRVSKDENGQLQVRLKASKMKPKKGERHCPAIEHRSENNGLDRSSLLLFMGVVGDVAVEKIYPQYFEINGLPERD